MWLCYRLPVYNCTSNWHLANDLLSASSPWDLAQREFHDIYAKSELFCLHSPGVGKTEFSSRKGAASSCGSVSILLQVQGSDELPRHPLMSCGRAFKRQNDVSAHLSTKSFSIKIRIKKWMQPWPCCDFKASYIHYLGGTWILVVLLYLKKSIAHPKITTITVHSTNVLSAVQRKMVPISLGKHPFLPIWTVE